MLENKVAIVTGGTGELGRVIVNKFSDAGIKVYVPVRSIETFREVFDDTQQAEYKLRRIFAFECDAENPNDASQFVDNVLKLEGRVDYLIAAVGGFHPKRNISEMDYELVDRMLKLNFITTFNFCRYVLPVMIKNNFGRIIAISARAGTEVTPGKFAYSVSKSAVIRLIQTINEENKQSNIKAHAIAPFIIDTPSNRQSMPNSDFSKWTPGEVIAEKIMLLISEEDNSKNNAEVIKL